jgi:hypothetical protein
MVVFMQVSACFGAETQSAAKCLLNVKGSQVQILSARP